MIEVQIDTGDLQKTVNELALYNRKVRDGVRREVSRYALRIQSEARTRVPVATNRLRSSIQTRFTVDRLGAVISTNTDYATDVEKGTDPHIVPIDNLTDWVRVKITANWEEARRIAGFVQHKIAEVGTDPQPYMAPAAEKYRQRFFDAIWEIIKNTK